MWWNRTNASSKDICLLRKVDVCDISISRVVTTDRRLRSGEPNSNQRNLRSKVVRYSRNIEKAFVRATTSHSLKTTSENRSWASNSVKARMTLGMWSGGISRRNRVLQLSQRVVSCIVWSEKYQRRESLKQHLH